MNPTYYTVTRFLWSIALKCDVWFRLNAGCIATS